MKKQTKNARAIGARAAAMKIYDAIDPPGHPSAVLIREARTLERLQTKRRRILKLLKAVDVQIRTTKRQLRGLAQQLTAEQSPPSKLFGEK